MTGPIDQRPIEHSPKSPKWGVLPGPDVGLQARDPFTIGGLKMKPRKQQRSGPGDFTVTQFVDVLEFQTAARVFFQLFDFAIAKRAVAIVIKRVIVHILIFTQDSPIWIYGQHTMKLMLGNQSPPKGCPGVYRTYCIIFHDIQVQCESDSIADNRSFRRSFLSSCRLQIERNR